MVVRFHFCRFEARTVSFTPLCLCLLEETVKTVGPSWPGEVGQSFTFCLQETPSIRTLVTEAVLIVLCVLPGFAMKKLIKYYEIYESVVVHVYEALVSVVGECT